MAANGGCWWPALSCDESVVQLSACGGDRGVYAVVDVELLFAYLSILIGISFISVVMLPQFPCFFIAPGPSFSVSPLYSCVLLSEFFSFVLCFVVSYFKEEMR